MKMTLKLTRVFLGFTALSMAACQSLPVEEYAADSDPSAEISKVQAERDELLTKHADVLSPKNFKAASQDLGKAEKLRSNNESSKDILKTLAKARTQYGQAADYTKIAQDTLPGVIAAREDAVKARADVIDGPGFRDAEKELRDLAEDMEDNNKAPALKKRGKLEGEYRAVELKALKRSVIGDAQNIKEQALKEGASEYAPSTLGGLNSEIAGAEGFIDGNRQNQSGLNELKAKLVTEAQHLLKITRESKATASPNGEKIVLEREAEALRVAAAQTALNQTRTELEKTNAALAAKSAEAATLESQKALVDRMKGVQASFTDKEADVVQDGNALVIRLKNLDFAVGSANIKSARFATLNKVRDVIQSFSPAAVTVVGHADSKGKAARNKEISLQRAESVKEYLASTLPRSAGSQGGTVIDAKGTADNQPVASNKTAAGRAQNRSVTVTILPQQANSAAH